MCEFVSFGCRIDENDRLLVCMGDTLNSHAGLHVGSLVVRVPNEGPTEQQYRAALLAAYPTRNQLISAVLPKSCGDLWLNGHWRKIVNGVIKE